MEITVEGDMDFRAHLEVGGSDDGHEADIHQGPTRSLGGDEDSQETVQEDRRGRVSKTGADIEALVEADQMREAWIKIHSWFQQAKGHTTPVNRDKLEQTSTLREDVYRQCPM